MSTPMALHQAKIDVGRVVGLDHILVHILHRDSAKGGQSMYKMNYRHLEELEVLD